MIIMLRWTFGTIFCKKEKKNKQLTQRPYAGTAINEVYIIDIWIYSIEMMHTHTHKKRRKNIKNTYRQISNISHTFVGNEIVDHSDVVGASLVGVAPTTYSFST